MSREITLEEIMKTDYLKKNKNFIVIVRIAAK